MLRKLFRERVQLNAVGGTYDELRYRPRQDDRITTVRRVAVEDETTTPTGSLRLYVDGHAYTHWLDEVPAPAVDRLYLFDDPIELLPGEDLVARITGCTAADALAMYISGWWEPINPEELALSLMRDILRLTLQLPGPSEG